MDYTLKSCPFCGCCIVGFYWDEDPDYVEDYTYVVECSECLARGGVFTSHTVETSKRGAVRLWNARTYKE